VRLDFSGADLSGCDFRDTVFEGGSLREAHLANTRFEGADLRDAELGTLRVRNASSFKRATISHAQAALLANDLGITVA
jgi:uncharacterized protein YjbI with pentapeptide repeats